MTVTYTSGEVAERLGIPPQKLHRWCRRGHIPGQPVEVGTGNMRTWTPEQIEHARLVAQAVRIKSASISELVGWLDDWMGTLLPGEGEAS